MLNLRTLLNLITFCALSAMGWCGYMTVVNGHDYLKLQTELEKSLDLRATAVSLQESPYDERLLKRLQTERASIEPKERQTLF